MHSLLADLADERIPVSRALRLALVELAGKVDPATQRWLEWELNGYPTSSSGVTRSVPDYRFPSALLMGEGPFGRVAPIHIPESDVEAKLTSPPLILSVAELEQLIAKGEPIQMTLSSTNTTVLLNAFQGSVRPFLLYDPGTLRRVLESARTRLLMILRDYLHAVPPSKIEASHTELEAELASYLAVFRRHYPDPTKAAFIMMPFAKTTAHLDIVTTIKNTLSTLGISGLRADDFRYSEDLLPNIRTYMHGCGFGVAVFERLVREDFNPNVSLEVGYMMGLGKPVCLLKDHNLKTLQSDLVGRLYESFDPLAAATIPEVLTTWLRQKGLVPPSAP